MVTVFIIGMMRKRPEYVGDSKMKISVIIPFRNEAKNLPELLQSLKGNFNKEVEFLFIDDHSTDGGSNLILNSGLENTKLIFLENETGKKAAIKKSIPEAKGEILVFTDADCVMEPGWLNKITSPIQSGEAEMVAGPVGISGNGFFARLQRLDLLALSASSYSMGNLSKPFMCSAANMAVLKSAWKDVKGEYDSGDDVFLLHRLKSEGKSICFVWERSAMVQTQPEASISGFLAQRIRWAGKSGGYSDYLSIVIALLVFFSAFSLLLGLGYSMFCPELLPTLLICLGIRASIDFLFLFLSERSLGNESDFWMYLPGFVFHLLYVPTAALASIIHRPDWKGRKIR